ncbi:SAM hydrolase/SAM-dependent halogenase family protein [Nocardiopsis ansamitocini]|uniref:SAM-dependent chlorinase/fluorinase n=1 Tax=Nocardiopsis ansamitocini TaxID=1670832 RepID=A0A9W6UGG3_9ACTN|nr:SAM-dependent chlorinase/fluorinase [Nocardiopsis ansamitocini]GLU47416.1 hypothetical protein Nans01_17670 [Nocardiopsis ansamitocini]
MTAPEGHSCLSFLTDYGNTDGFVAACHAQMLRYAPALRVIDITHQIPPGDIRRGATVLADTAPELPRAVHVCVVDPGVGTRRRSVAVAAGGHVLVGPDNGLLVWAAEALGGVAAVHELTNETLWRHPVSTTFHGRDVYAPVGAQIAAGTPLADVGRALAPTDLVRLPRPRREVRPGAAYGEVHAVDRFGNCQLSLSAQDLRAALAGSPQPEHLAVGLPGSAHTLPLAPTFGAVEPGAPLVLTDSAGRLSLAVNGGDAARTLDLSVGDPVDLTV